LTNQTVRCHGRPDPEASVSKSGRDLVCAAWIT